MKRSPIKRKLGRLKRGARIPSASKKRSAINRKAGPWRQAFKQEIGRCEKCLQTPDVLDCHEIVDAWARRFCLMHRGCILVLCRSCHDELEGFPKLWPVARQAALLRTNRPADFLLSDLNRFLTRRLDLADVDSAALTLDWRAV